MIHKISIENFFSIADRQEIILTVADNAPALPCFRSSLSKNDTVLPLIISFFGSNASGKSTVLRSIISTVAFFCDSFLTGVDDPIPHFQPYQRQDWWNKPSKISVEFDYSFSHLKKSALLRYELHIAHAENSAGKYVAYEALSYAPEGKFRKLFERHAQDFKFGKEFDLSKNDKRIESVRPNAGIISTLAQLNHPLSLEFKLAISKVQTNIRASSLPSLSEHQLSFYVKEPDYLTLLNKELARLDVGLEEMIIDKNAHGFFAKFKHTGLDTFIFLEEESLGTQRFIEIFPKIQYALKTGGIAIIDELDIHLHSLLMPELFRWFYTKDRNPFGAQLFFTAHNPALLDEMEKEQIFLTEKNIGNPTTVYGARDIRGLRRGPSLMKKYLAGELGAVPYIG